jgi:predicted DNA-binding transcriptional regulator YafY
VYTAQGKGGGIALLGTVDFLDICKLRQSCRNFSDRPVEHDKLIKLKITFSPCSAYRIYDEFDGSDIEILEDGSMLVEKKLPEDEWLYGFLLSLGTSVRVLEPQSVRERFLEKIEALKKFYSVP